MKKGILVFSLMLVSMLMGVVYYAQAKSMKVALLDLDEDGEITSIECHSQLSKIKITGTGTAGRQIDVYLDQPRSATSPYLIKCGKTSGYIDSEYKTIGSDTVGSDGKFECYLDTTDYNNTVLAGHKLYVYTYDPQTWYAYKLQGSKQGQAAPNCARWSTNFICNSQDKQGNYNTLEHSLNIKCAGKEYYNKASRTGNMNETIMLPEGENCEATCHSLDNTYQMYGYNIGNSLGVVADNQLTKVTNEKVSFVMDKSKTVYRWIFKNPNEDPTPDPKVTMKVKCQSNEITVTNVPPVDSSDARKTLECDNKNDNVTIEWSTDSKYKYCQMNGPLGWMGLTLTDTYQPKSIDLNGSITKEWPKDEPQIRIMCSVGNKGSDGAEQQAGLHVDLTVKASTCIAENQNIVTGKSCCSGLEVKDGKCVKADTSKVKFKLIGNIRDSESKEKIADVGSNVKMTIECSDGKVRNLSTKDGYFIYNINNLPVSGCKLINNTDALVRNNWSIADYEYKGYTLCKDSEIGKENASCATNVITKNSWDMSSITDGSKYQIVYQYDKLDVQNEPVNSDLEDKIDQLILMIKKILEKLGISL